MSLHPPFSNMELYEVGTLANWRKIQISNFAPLFGRSTSKHVTGFFVRLEVKFMFYS